MSNKKQGHTHSGPLQHDEVDLMNKNIIKLVLEINKFSLLLSCFNTTVVHYMEALNLLDNEQLNTVKKALVECQTVTYCMCKCFKVYSVLIPL